MIAEALGDKVVLGAMIVVFALIAIVPGVWLGCKMGRTFSVLLGGSGPPSASPRERQQPLGGKPEGRFGRRERQRQTNLLAVMLIAVCAIAAFGVVLGAPIYLVVIVWAGAAMSLFSILHTVRRNGRRDGS